MENRLVQPGSSSTARYAYDTANKRVWRGDTGVDEIAFWAGQKLATYQITYTGAVMSFGLTSTNVHFGTKLISKGSYNVTGSGDYISLTAVIADRLGSIGKFYPYGVERPSATGNDKEKFTGYFRDASTGLDYANQRYHQPGVGRFITPDPNGSSTTAAYPGTNNKYTYAAGDPINNTDSTGLNCQERWALWSGPCPSAGDIGDDDDDDGGWGAAAGPCGADDLLAASDGCYTPDPGQTGSPTPAKPPPLTCDQLLAMDIDDLLMNYKGMTPGGSRLFPGLSTWGTPGTDAGTYLVNLGEQTGVDPAFILGIAGAESSLATNPHINGGIYNVYGNSAHFTKNKYTNYVDPTLDAFSTIKGYIQTGIGVSTRSMYVKYEGESKTKPKMFEKNLGVINKIDGELFGNLNNVGFSCDSVRRADLAADLGIQ